jgi:hypothetical protein
MNLNCPCAKHEDRVTATRILTHDVWCRPPYTAALLLGARSEGPKGRLLWRTETILTPQQSVHESSMVQSVTKTLYWVGYRKSIMESDCHMLHIIIFTYQKFLIVIYFINIMFDKVCWLIDWIFYDFLQLLLENVGILFQTRLRLLFQTFFPIFICIIFSDRSRWPWGLRNKSATARLLVWRVWILVREWIFVCCVFVCCVGSNLCVSWSSVQRSPEVCVYVSNCMWSINLNNEAI